MKAADGTPIAEIVRYWTTCEDGIHGMDPAPQGKGNWVRYTDHLAALSAAEDRERVLRDAVQDALFALPVLRSVLKAASLAGADTAQKMLEDARAALATPAPEHCNAVIK